MFSSLKILKKNPGMEGLLTKSKNHSIPTNIPSPKHIIIRLLIIIPCENLNVLLGCKGQPKP